MATLSTLKRCKKIDAALQGGLYVPEFARKNKVSRQLVYRDLAAFRKLGFRIERRRERGEVWWDRWEYDPPGQALFAENLG